MFFKARGYLWFNLRSLDGPKNRTVFVVLLGPKKKLHAYHAIVP